MTKYSEEYDAKYNKEKDIWLEKKCSDRECTFCKDRPSKPSEIKNERP